MPNTSLFAAGTIAALESKLIARERLNAMADAAGFEEAYKLLAETGFGEGEGGGDEKRYEELFAAEERKNNALLSDLSSDEGASLAFLLKNDYHNLKTLLKAKVTDSPYEKIKDYLYAGGTAEVSVLQAEIYSDGAGLRPFMRDAVQALAAETDPQKIDVAVDLAMYADINALLPRIKSASAAEYFRRLFDYVNISAFIRNKLAGTEDFSAQIIEGGYLQTGFFDFSLGAEEFVRALKESIYGEAGEIAEEALSKHGNLAGYERYYKSKLLELVVAGKTQINTVGPLVWYFLTKKTEIDNVRLILTCKKNKVSKEKIYQRLRELYA